MVVMAIVGVAMAVVSLAIRDPAQSQLEKEAARLVALIESARAEARSLSTEVLWVPSRGDVVPSFRFVGGQADPTAPSYRWLDDRVRAEVVGVGLTSVTLGPEPMLPAQRIRLRLDEHSLDISSDGLSAFAVAAAPEPRTP